jgi:signal transduction histidine kinase
MLSLRWVACGTLGLFILYSHPAPLSLTTLGNWSGCFAMVLASIALHRIPPEVFRRHLLHFLIFLLDLVLVSIAVYEPHSVGLAFYVTLVLCILSGAVTGEPKSSFIFAGCASILYLIQVTMLSASAIPLLEPGTLLRVPLFLIFALNAALLSRGAERSLRRRSETLLAIDRRLTITMSQREIGKAIGEALRKPGRYRRAAIYLIDADQATFRRSHESALPAVLEAGALGGPIADRLRLGKAVTPEHLETAPALVRLLGTRRAATFIMPARFSDRQLGILVAESKAWILDPDAEADFLGHVAERAASAVMNARMIENAQEAVIGLHSLLKMSEAVTSSLRIRDILTLLENFSRNLVGVRACRLWVVRSVLGATGSDIGPARDAVGTGPGIGLESDLVPLGTESASLLELAAALKVMETGNDLFLNSPDAVASVVPSSGVQNLMALPLRTADEILGVLEAIDKPSPFDQRDHSLLAGLASQATIALVNARLYEGLEDRATRITRLVDTLGAEKQKLEHVLSNMEEAVVLLDRSGQVVLLNHAGRRSLAPLGRVELPAAAARFEDPLGLLPRLAAVLDGHDSIHETLSGGERFYGFSAARLQGEDGAIAVMRDITELVRIDAMRSDFVSHVSHELRTPLAAIIGSIKLIVDGRAGDLTDTQGRLLNIVERESGRLMHLINDLLDLAKLEAGRTRIEVQDTDLATVVAEAIETTQPLAVPKSIQLTTACDELRGPVPCDASLIRQVLHNLIGNAIKFTAEGGSVRVQVKTTSDGVEVRTIDTGIGIPRDKWEAVFNKFEQVGAHRGPVKGTGLGLAICRQIIERHGGRIWVESEEGVGSTFIFTLPAAQSELAVEPGTQGSTPGRREPDPESALARSGTPALAKAA